MRPPSATPLAPPITAPFCVRLMEPSLAQPSSIALNTVNKAAMRSPGIFIIFMLWSYLWREIVAAAITLKGPAGVSRRGISRQARDRGRGVSWTALARLSRLSVVAARESHPAAARRLRRAHARGLVRGRADDRVGRSFLCGRHARRGFCDRAVADFS